MDLFSLFKDFYSVAIVNKYPANVRGVYDSLLYDFNARFFPEHCIYTQRELSEMTGLSLSTLHRALKFLSERGHITVRSSKKGTVIRLRNETPVEHKWNTNGTQGAAVGLVSYTPQAHAEVSNTNLKTKNEETKKEEEARARVSEMDVQDLWEYETGYALHGSIAYELESLEKTYGRESFHSALIKAMQSSTSPKLRFSYFKKVLENLNKPQTTSKKGGERNDNATENQRDYKQPDTSKDPDWRKYLKQ